MSTRLAKYRKKRDFNATPEPRAHGMRTRRAASAQYVIQLHHARSRHFDFRLQVGDSLRSWAVPKGPSLDPSQKRLAVEVEDHPLDYGSFEGTIPQGQYGAGKVWIWDRGSWAAEGDARQGLKSGRMRFSLDGERLHGAWSLVRTRQLHGKQPQWLLIKSRDAQARPGDEADDVPLSQWRESKPASAANDPAPRRRRRAPAEVPQRIGLQLARLASRPPPGDDWLHEVKFDGYRLVLWRDGSRVRIGSRGDQDWTSRLSAAVRALRRLTCDSCVLDAELIALDERGRSSFGLLQQRFGEGEAGLAVMAFDLLFIDGEDLRGRPQLERKQRLAELLRNAAAPLHLAEYVQGHGAEAAHNACAEGQEGIISKAVDAPYAEGRGGAWLKVKCVQSDEYAVIGYTTGKGARAKLGSLLLARPEAGGTWRYMGRVGTGLSDAGIRDLLGQLKPSGNPVELEQAPDRTQLRGARPLWVEPTLVVEVEYRGITEDGLLRQASVKGVRADRSVRSLSGAQRNRAVVSKPDQAPARRKPAKRKAATDLPVKLTHPDRVLFQEPRITKQELAAFYGDIAGHVLPGLTGRPLMLLRCPDGADGECFYQKHVSPGFPDAVHQVLDPADKKRWLYIDDAAGLIGLVQMNCLEFHTWGSTAADLDHADRVVIDLDPAADVPWKQVRQAALLLRRQLEDLKLQSFVRTTGGKGLHVVIPLRPTPWEPVRAFAQALAATLARREPERYVAVASKAKRGGRIFVDYLRNGRGATAVASYSLRNRPGAPVATPLGWDELARLKSPQQYNYGNIRQRLARLGKDPWAGADRLRQVLPRIEG